MGNFTNRIKNIFNPKGKSSSGPEAPRADGKQRMLDLYFLRCKSDKTLYIHPDGTDIFQPVYALKAGTIGAAAFTNEMAERLIDLWDAAPIEKVHFEQAKKEGVL